MRTTVHIVKTRSGTRKLCSLTYYIRSSKNSVLQEEMDFERPNLEKDDFVLIVFHKKIGPALNFFEKIVSKDPDGMEMVSDGILKKDCIYKYK